MQDRRSRRRSSRQLATSLSKEMHQFAVLPTQLVGTYSCHGIDSNLDKINQDAACICYPLAEDPHTALLLVVDGHGELGHDVTDEVVKQLIGRTEQHDWSGPDAGVETQLVAAFEETQRALHEHYLPDGTQPAGRSGACVLMLVLRPTRLSVAHVGDCRAVLGTFDGEKLFAEDLSIDHTPGDEGEAARLHAFGAYVQPAKEQEAVGRHGESPLVRSSPRGHRTAPETRPLAQGNP